MYKTHTCGELRGTHAGQTVTLAGWVHKRRDHGGVVFIDLRDRFGLTQVVINPDLPTETLDLVSNVRSEWVLQVTGLVRERPAGMQNPKMPTGEVEVCAAKVVALNTAKALPFMISSDEEVDENTRLKYRYLDLRRDRMQRNLILRHEVVLFMRKYLSERGFLEIETPSLFKTTPEGARDYLVPSRVYPGHCSWWLAWSDTSRSPAASAMKISAATASPSSPSLTWKCLSSIATTYWTWLKAYSPPCSRLSRRTRSYCHPPGRASPITRW
jgi:aspartyl-tRNA synthetase